MAAGSFSLGLCTESQVTNPCVRCSVQCHTVNVLSSLQRPDQTERMVDAPGIQRGKLEMARVAFTKTSSVSRAWLFSMGTAHGKLKKISEVPQESEARLHGKHFNHYSDPLPLQGT